MTKKNTNIGFELTKEEKIKLQEEIKYYFQEEREEELGVLGTESILDFFLNTMGSHIYNKALDDAKVWFGKRMENLESDFYSMYKS